MPDLPKPAHTRRTGLARLVIAILIAILTTAALLLANHQQNGGQDEALQRAITQLFAGHATTLDGKPQTFAQWQGKIVVINYWATWCPPCREEMPALARLSRKFSTKGVQFVGIAIDSADNVQKFTKSPAGIDPAAAYPLLVGAIDALEQSQALGNTRQALPFTIIIDRQGQHYYSRIGAIDESRLEGHLNTLTTSP